MSMPDYDPIDPLADEETCPWDFDKDYPESEEYDD